MRTSKILNKKSSFFGLGSLDFLFLSLVYIVSQMIFFPLGLEVLSFVIVILTLLILMPLRLKYRKKLIRDGVFYFFVKFIKRGVLHVRKEV